MNKNQWYMSVFVPYVVANITEQPLTRDWLGWLRVCLDDFVRETGRLPITAEELALYIDWL